MATTRKLLIQWGDGASPEVFAFSCSINTNREFTIEATPIETNTPNCTDLDAAGWIERVIDTLSAGISGAGTMDPDSFADLRTKMLAAAAFNMRVKIDETGANGGGYFEGSFVMTSLGIAKEGKATVSCSVELASNGEITWTAAA